MAYPTARPTLYFSLPYSFRFCSFVPSSPLIPGPTLYSNVPRSRLVLSQVGPAYPVPFPGRVLDQLTLQFPTLQSGGPSAADLPYAPPPPGTRAAAHATAAQVQKAYPTPPAPKGGETRRPRPNRVPTPSSSVPTRGAR